MHGFTCKGLAAPAMAALAARAAGPTHAHARARLPAQNIRPNLLDHADHLMPRNAWIAYPRHEPLHGDGIAMAHAAGLHLYPHLTLAGHGQISLNHLEFTTDFG